MFDDYQIPAIAVIAALMLAFAYLHERFQNVRSLLWILALSCAEIQSILLWVVSHDTGTIHGIGTQTSIWLTVVGQSALMLSSVLFLASLSPISFRIGEIRILYAVPYVIPLLIYSTLYYGPLSLTHGQYASGALLWLYWFLAICGIAVAAIWCGQRGAIPIWVALSVAAVATLACALFLIRGNVYQPLLVVESGNMLMAALLVVFTFRRLSPGVILATTGFLAWGFPPFFLIEPADKVRFFGVVLARIVILGKVIVATGLVLVVLEDEIEKNQVARRRERRVRLELETYARQALAARSMQEFDRDSIQICTMITQHSCFAGAAVVARGGIASYTITGYAGMDGATAGALDALVQRLPSTCFSTGKMLASESTALDLDLTPWLIPGDDLERLHLTRVAAVPMLGSDNTTEGVLLLTDSRVPMESLRADDLLPLEILAGRMQAARTQAMMLGKLIESERFAGVGQLATNVAHQLNNPLTVILGYSALLEESTPEGPARRGAEAIGTEARRMKGILERLARFSSLSTERFSSFSVIDLLFDIEQLHRTDFLRHSIDFRVSIARELPSIFGNPHQVRQALLHVVQYAIDSVIRIEPTQEKTIRIEATAEEGRVRVLIIHSGPGLTQPERAFDSLSTGHAGGEATGIGLSLCAAIVREHRGNISAVNNESSGTAVLIELPIS